MTTLPLPVPDDDYDRAEFDKLLHQLAKVICVPYLQLKAIVETQALSRRTRPRRETYAHLRGAKITISQAAKKYSTPGTTLRGWTDKGYITVLEDSHPKKLDEADVAFCVAVKAQRDKLGITAKVPFFDEAGEPVYAAKYEAILTRRHEKASLAQQPADKPRQAPSTRPALAMQVNGKAMSKPQARKGTGRLRPLERIRH